MYSLQAQMPGALLDWPAVWGEGFSPEGSRSLLVVCEESLGAAGAKTEINLDAEWICTFLFQIVINKNVKFKYFQMQSVKIYLVVDLQRVIQCPDLTVGNASPDGSVLGRQVGCLCGVVDRIVLWREVSLWGEGGYDTSLKWDQFIWRQAALQCAGRVWWRQRQTSRESAKETLDELFIMILPIMAQTSSVFFLCNSFSPAMKSNA